MAPQTGLSLLMNGGMQQQQQQQQQQQAQSSSAAINEKQRRFQQEIRDRDRQASALAAAGMVAESVSLTKTGQQQQVAAGLQAPPQLLAQQGTPVTAASTSELDSINWNLMDMAGAANFDDMDLDFAELFDPANELANMYTEGSGWPSSAAATANAASTTTATETSHQQQQQQTIAPSKPPPTSS